MLGVLKYLEPVLGRVNTHLNGAWMVALRNAACLVTHNLKLSLVGVSGVYWCVPG